MNSDIDSYFIDNATPVKSSENYCSFVTFKPYQKWQISGNQDEFWNLYCDKVSDEKFESDTPLNVGELNQELMPVIVEFNLSFQQKYNNNSDSDDDSDEITYDVPYGDDFIINLVHCCQLSIANVYDISNQKVELYCCVLTPH